MAKAVLIGAIPPLMLKTASNPSGTPREAFDPMLILHGDDDQIVPIAASAPLAAKLVKNAQLKIYKGAPHGMCTTHKDRVNGELLAFFRS